MRLNLGCGGQVPDGWINVDYALGARLAKVPFFKAANRRLGLFDMDWDQRIYVHDLTTTFPWKDCSIEAIYSSHTLEHLSKEDGRRFLEQCHRVLQVNGIIRLVVPDLRHVVDDYIDGRVPADDFLQALDVLYRRTGGRLKQRLAPFVQFPHLCMYDHSALLQALSETGFQACARTPFDSDIDDIALVEQESRTNHAVIVEGRKMKRWPS